MTELTITLEQLAKELEARFEGDANCVISSVATLKSAKKGDLSFFSNAKYLEQLKETKASVVLVSEEYLKHCPTNALVTDNPYLALAKISQKLNNIAPPEPGIDPSANISDCCRIQPSAYVGPNVFIGDNVQLGENVIIESGVHIGANCVIGDDTHIYPNVVLYSNVKVGKRGIVHSNAVLGADGFGIANHEGSWVKVPQIGGVTIEDDVEVGAGTTIDRGAIEDTVIEQGVKLDNQIQIAHNVRIGAHTAIAGCTAVAGSAVIGKYCVIGGGSMISGHLSICDGVMLTGGTQVGLPIDKPGTYASGLGCKEKLSWGKIVAQLYKLTELVKRVRSVEKKLTSLEEGKHE